METLQVSTEKCTGEAMPEMRVQIPPVSKEEQTNVVK